MLRARVAAPLFLLAVPVVAQKAEVRIDPAKQVTRFTVETSSKIDNDRRVLVDGEEMSGRFGRGGGGGSVETSEKVVFDEGPAGSGWREYRAAEASTKRPGRDGEPRENKVTGALAGKKVFLSEDDGGVVVREGDAKAEPLPRPMADGVPVKMALSGLLPSGEFDVGAEFDLSKNLPAALASFVHPIVPAGFGERAGRPGRGQRGEGGARGEGGQRGRRGEGGEGQRGRRGQRGEGGEGGQRGEGGRRGEGAQRGRRGQRGEGGQGGQGGRRGGGFGGFRGPRPVRDEALAALINTKLKCDATGKLTAIEEKDGRTLATIDIVAKMSGSGSPADLGMFGGFGGRGGRGGGASGKGSIDVAVKGVLVVDTTAHQLHSLTLSGDLKSSSETQRDTPRGEFEMSTKSNGKFKLSVLAEGKASDQGH